MASVHDGHRARRKAQFREHGLDTFTDHGALELLLFYAVPQRDVNPLAHRLLNRFGSLEAVLSAPPEELQSVKGVGEHAATLLTLVVPMVRRAYRESVRNGTALCGTEQLGRYFSSLFFGVQEEMFYEVCLDAKGKLLRCCKIADGSVGAVHIDVRRVVENALRSRASAVALSHNHPSGVALPSPDDNTTTLMVYDALRTVGIELIDHIIVADGDYVSLRDNGLLPPR